MAQRGGISTEIEKALKGIHYPASKDELVQKAKNNDVNHDVIINIEKLPEKKFNSPNDVKRTLNSPKVQNEYGGGSIHRP